MAHPALSCWGTHDGFSNRMPSLITAPVPSTAGPIANQSSTMLSKSVGLRDLARQPQNCTPKLAMRKNNTEDRDNNVGGQDQQHMVAEDMP